MSITFIYAIMLLQDRTRTYQRGDIMIKIEVRDQDSLPFYLSVKGHAGTDLTCAGVSAIIQTAGNILLRGLETWNKAEWKYLNASGMFTIEFLNREKYQTEKTMARDWMLNIVAMLYLFANQHPEEIKWYEVEV